MKLTINGVTVSFDNTPKEIVFNNGEITIINNDNVSSKEDVCVSEYTIDNPKLVDSYLNFEGMETFTGVVKDEDDVIAHYLNGELHRKDGPAVEWANGDKEWRLNNTLHREDGPAVEYYNGNKEWCLNNTLHRKDGSAVEWANGDKEWWFDGENYGRNDAFTNDAFTKESWIAFVATLKAAKRK